MATTAIESGQIVRRTQLMSLAKAEAFAKLAKANPLMAREVRLIPCGDKARVEFVPAKAETVYRHFCEKQNLRAERAADVRKYVWRRIGRGVWACRGPEPRQRYTVALVAVGNKEPHCTCPDWPRISSVGGKCKHFITAEEAEKRYQRDHSEGKPQPVVRESENPFQTLPLGGVA